MGEGDEKQLPDGTVLNARLRNGVFPGRGFPLTGEGEMGSMLGRPTPLPLSSLHDVIPGITVCAGLGSVDLAGQRGDLHFPEFPFLWGAELGSAKSRIM